MAAMPDPQATAVPPPPARPRPRPSTDRAGAPRSERALHDLDRAVEDRRDIEADLLGPYRRAVLQPARRQAAQAGLLGVADRLHRRAEGGRRARLDLAEDEDPLVPHDEVELAVAAAPVAGD